jgi:hypothetical protein
MSELTLTLLRLGLLALLWIFIFSVVGVLRTDLYGTSVSRRTQRRAQKAQEKQQRQGARSVAATPPAQAPAAHAGQGSQASQAGPVHEAAPPGGFFGRGRQRRTPTVLVVTEGPLVGTSLPLRGAGILIGRNPECSLVLDDDYASGRHCRIFQGTEGWLVEDLGSTNGTFVGGPGSKDKLTTPRPVEVGTTLRIGKTVLELRD